MSLNIGIISSSYKAAAPSANLLLDDYPGAAAAYSLRKLRTAYSGSAIRVRRSSDNAEQNIGFVNNILDTTTLLTFCGSGSGFVTIWYDQSGNSNNLTQSSIPVTPSIVLLGVLQTLNGNPAVRIVPLNFFNITSPIVSNTNISIFMTGKADSLSLNGLILGAISGPAPQYGYISAVPNYFYQGQLNGAANGLTASGYGTANYVIHNIVVNSTNYYPYQNNTLFSFTKSGYSPSTNNFSTVGRYATFYSNANYSELIFYKSDQLSNRTAIVNNTNTFYTIF